MPYEDVTLHTSDGLDLRRLVRPSRNGAAVIVYPGRDSAQKHARYLSRRVTASCSSTAAARAPATATRTASAGPSTRTSRRAFAFLRDRADVEPGRIGGLGLSVGGEMMLQTRRRTRPTSRPSSPTAPAPASSRRSCPISRARSACISAPLLVVKTAAVALFSNHAPPRTSPPTSSASARGRSCSSTPRKGEVDNKTPEYLAAARGPAEEWEVPQGGHTAGVARCPRSTRGGCCRSSTGRCADPRSGSGSRVRPRCTGGRTGGVWFP